MGYRQSREGEAETLPPPLSPACQSDTSFPCEVGPCEVGNPPRPALPAPPPAPSRGAGSVWRLARIQCTGKDRIFDEGPLNTVVDAIPCLPRVAENLSRWITPASPPRLPMESRAMDGTCIAIGQTPHPETLFSACCIRRRPIACRDRFIYRFCHDRLLAWGATPAGISFWHRCA